MERCERCVLDKIGNHSIEHKEEIQESIQSCLQRYRPFLKLCARRVNSEMSEEHERRHVTGTLEKTLTKIFNLTDKERSDNESRCTSLHFTSYCSFTGSNLESIHSSRTSILYYTILYYTILYYTILLLNKSIY